MPHTAPKPDHFGAPETGAGSSAVASTEQRRTFLSLLVSAAMTFGLAGGYGMFFGLAGRFLFPARSQPKARLFVELVSRIAPGGSLSYRSPAGQLVTITRRGAGETVDEFIALSSVCPHLGCRVHWEGHNNRFFCPCHNGVFDPQGRATEGPPADAGQSLARFPLSIDNGMLFIEVNAAAPV